MGLPISAKEVKELIANGEEATRAATRQAEAQERIADALEALVLGLANKNLASTGPR